MQRDEVEVCKKSKTERRGLTQEEKDWICE